MELAYDDTGRGKVVVLLHAFPLSRQMWAPQREALKDTCRLITPDLPGFGDSPTPDEAPTVESMADAVLGLLQKLGVAEPIVLGGLSMGGYVALAFARRYADRLRGLILADTRAEADDDAAKAKRDELLGFAHANPASAVLEQMLPKMVAKDARPEAVAEVKRIAALQRPAGVVGALQMLRDRPDARPTLSTVSVPTLVVVGKEDALTPPALSEAMAGQIAGAKLVVIDGAGHLSNLERPEAFSGALREFLATL